VDARTPARGHSCRLTGIHGPHRLARGHSSGTLMARSWRAGPADGHGGTTVTLVLGAGPCAHGGAEVRAHMLTGMPAYGHGGAGPHACSCAARSCPVRMLLCCIPANTRPSRGCMIASLLSSCGCCACAHAPLDSLGVYTHAQCTPSGVRPPLVCACARLHSTPHPWC
jgi:hypothetical protein